MTTGFGRRRDAIEGPCGAIEEHWGDGVGDERLPPSNRGFATLSLSEGRGASFSIPERRVRPSRCGLQIRSPERGFATHSSPERSRALRGNPPGLVGPDERAADYKSALRSRAAIGRTPKAQPSLSPTATRSSEVSVALSGFESVRASSGRLRDRVGVAVGLTSRWPGERTSVRAGVEGLTSNRTRHPPPGASG